MLADFQGRTLLESRKRTLQIVFNPELLYQHLDLGQGYEQQNSQARISESAVSDEVERRPYDSTNRHIQGEP
jgi:hypothetical protein